MIKNGENGVRMGKIGSEWAKMGQNGVEMGSEWGKIGQNGGNASKKW